jgi:hypothetical protein
MLASISREGESAVVVALSLMVFVAPSAVAYPRRVGPVCGLSAGALFAAASTRAKVPP